MAASIPEGLVHLVPEPQRSSIVTLWTTANRLQRKGWHDRANVCYRRIIAIKNPIRVQCGTEPFPER